MKWPDPAPAQKIIVSDTKSAVSTFAEGRVSPRTSTILAKAKRVRKFQITWTPDQSGLTRNERAHDAARGLIDRADDNPTCPHLARSARDSWYLTGKSLITTD